jgi:hypothetical protein
VVIQTEAQRRTGMAFLSSIMSARAFVEENKHETHTSGRHPMPSVHLSMEGERAADRERVDCVKALDEVVDNGQKHA